jgi:hypothetical protein
MSRGEEEEEDAIHLDHSWAGIWIAGLELTVSVPKNLLETEF